MATINLKYGNKSFNSDDLKKHIQRMGKNYIIQGQTHCSRAKHRKPNSLDYWLRDNNHRRNRNTKQADNKVIEDLVNTGGFEEGKFRCPDSGRMCKGIKIVQRCKMPNKTIQRRNTHR